MRIFHVITTLNKGGAESHLASLCRAQRQRGMEVTIAYLKGDGYWVPALEHVGVRTIALTTSRYADLSAFSTLEAAIATAQPDIVHAHMPPAELYANYAVRRQRRSGFVISKHVDRHPFYGGPAKDWLERFCATPADAIICISQAVNDYFVGRWPERLSRKLTTVRYGLTPTGGGDDLQNQAAALRREWRIESNEVLYGTVARLTEQKSIDTLLRAFAGLRRHASAPVRLAIVGQGPLEASLRSLASDLGIADKVVWAGFRTDIPVVMRALDVFTLSSIYEGFGLVLLEAMEASCPIVASDVSAIPEIVVDGKAGKLVPPREPLALAQAMAPLLTADVRARMGRAGYERLVADFSVDRMTDLTMAVYNQALQCG